MIKKRELERGDLARREVQLSGMIANTLQLINYHNAKIAAHQKEIDQSKIELSVLKKRERALMANLEKVRKML